jgi:hypothetical protein
VTPGLSESPEKARMSQEQGKRGQGIHRPDGAAIPGFPLVFATKTRKIHLGLNRLSVLRETGLRWPVARHTHT